MFNRAVMIGVQQHSRGCWRATWLCKAVAVTTPAITGEVAIAPANRSLIELMPWSTTSGGRSGRSRPPQGKGSQHIVGQREPQQDRAHLFFAAHQQPGEPHAAGVGVGALGGAALLIHYGAALARHPLAPIRHSRAVLGARRIRLSAVLVAHRRAPQSGA